MQVYKKLLVSVTILKSIVIPYQLRSLKKITIIAYHSISSNPDKYTISQEAFRRQVEFIKQNYTIIRLKDIQDEFKVKNNDRKVIITFDDAFTDFYYFAYPILQKYSVPCTLFVPTGLIGKYNEWDFQNKDIKKMKIMTEEQLLSLAKTTLVDFGSHTVDHVSLRNLSYDEMGRQVVQSKNMLENLIGKKIIMFAYPYGNLDDFSSLTSKILKESGYEIALASRWGTLNSKKQILQLKRIFFTENDDFKDIKDKIEGYYDWFTYKERLGFLLRSIKRAVRRRHNATDEMRIMI